jgi:hypothetical protein
LLLLAVVVMVVVLPPLLLLLLFVGGGSFRIRGSSCRIAREGLARNEEAGGSESAPACVSARAVCVANGRERTCERAHHVGVVGWVGGCACEPSMYSAAPARSLRGVVRTAWPL